MKKSNRFLLMLLSGLCVILLTLSSCKKEKVVDDGDDPPVITSVSPANVSIGQSITISGTGLSSPTVQIATKVATVTSQSATSVVVVIPAGIALGAASVRVTTAHGSVVYSGSLTIQ